MPLVGGTADCILDDDHPVSEIDSPDKVLRHMRRLNRQNLPESLVGLSRRLRRLQFSTTISVRINDRYAMRWQP